MKSLVRQFHDFFVSLRLTVVLLALSIVLIFWATLAQVDIGVWGVQQKFFHSLFVLQKIPGTEIPVPVFPGGYLIGGMLLINLICAHVSRFKLTWRKAGIWLVHSGLILLLIGELLSGIFQRDYDLTLNNGETRNYTESERYNEVAIVDATNPKFDDVTVIPERLIANGTTIQNPKLPFQVVTRMYYPNAALQMRRDLPSAPASLATQGFGPQIAAIPIPITYKEDERNLPAAFIELIALEGSLGTWLVSPELPMPQHFSYGGRDWKISMRFQRRYLPFSVTLVKFSHDIYPGTDIAKNFSSRVRVTPPGESSREVLIYMNNPMRTAGLTFYQKSFANNDNTTILQVVRNPSWRMPYIACCMMVLGLVLQFCQHLAAFARKRRAGATVPAKAPSDPEPTAPPSSSAVRT